MVLAPEEPLLQLLSEARPAERREVLAIARAEDRRLRRARRVDPAVERVLLVVREGDRVGQVDRVVLGRGLDLGLLGADHDEPAAAALLEAREPMVMDLLRDQEARLLR